MSAILHLLSRSSRQGNGLQQCLQNALADDALILLEEAVVEGLGDSPSIALLKQRGVAVYVIQADLEKRGLGAAGLCEGVTGIDYATMTALVIDFKLSQTWS